MPLLCLSSKEWLWALNVTHAVELWLSVTLLVSSILQFFFITCRGNGKAFLETEVRFCLYRNVGCGWSIFFYWSPVCLLHYLATASQTSTLFIFFSHKTPHLNICVRIRSAQDIIRTQRCYVVLCLVSCHILPRDKNGLWQQSTEHHHRFNYTYWRGFDSLGVSWTRSKLTEVAHFHSVGPQV